MNPRLPLSPGFWPALFALLPATWCISRGVAILVTSAHAGPQSSTTGLGAGLAFVGALLLGGLGMLAGHLATYILPEPPAAARRRFMGTGAVLLVAVAAFSWWQASAPIQAADRAATPRVLVNTANVRRQATAMPAGELAPGTRVYEYAGGINRVLTWGSSSVQLVDHDDALEVRIAPQGHVVQVPETGIDYIIHVDAAPLRLGVQQRPALALLITGRATGRRDLLAVIADGGELVYLELLERFWNFRQGPLTIAPSTAGDRIVVGSDPQRVLVFSP